MGQTHSGERLTCNHKRIVIITRKAATYAYARSYSRRNLRFWPGRAEFCRTCDDLFFVRGEDVHPMGGTFSGRNDVPADVAMRRVFRVRP